MRKICLLGGTGFVGKPLINHLMKKGWQIRLPTRQREKHRELLVLPKLELVSANIHEQEQLNKQLVGCEAVINLVGILNEKGHDGTGFRKAHVELPEKLMTACRENNVKRILHVSALNANATEGKSHYARTKGEAENLLHAAQDLDVTTFKPSLIIGEGAPFINNFATLLRVPTPIFMLPSATAKFAPIWVNDVAEAMVQTLNSTRHYGQRYNLCGSKVYTLQELVAYIAKLIQVKRHILPLNEKYSYWVARFMERMPGKPYSLDNFYSSLVENVCGDNNHLSQLGITPHAIENIMSKYFSNASTPRELYSTLRHFAGRELSAFKS